MTVSEKESVKISSFIFNSNERSAGSSRSGVYTATGKAADNGIATIELLFISIIADSSTERNVVSLLAATNGLALRRFRSDRLIMTTITSPFPLLV